MPKCSFHIVWMPTRLVAKYSCIRSYGAYVAPPAKRYIHLEHHVPLHSQIRHDALQLRHALLVLLVATATHQHQSHVRELIICA